MRVTSSKSRNSESFYINQSYIDKNGKNTSRNYRKLGTLKELSEKLGTDRDGVLAWCREECRRETARLKAENETVSISLSPSLPIRKDTGREVYCGELFLDCLLRDMKFKNIFRNIDSRHKYQFNLFNITRDLIAARVICPGSKLSTYATVQKFIEPPKYELEDVYRALSVLAEESDYIQAETYRSSNLIHPRNQTVLYYDCTNYYFEIEQEDEIRRYGKSKENRPNPIIGMGLFMDADGIPLAFDIHPGNQNEQLTLKPLEKKVIRDFDCSKFIYCSDSGLGSEDNKQFNDIEGRAYVITQSLKKMKAEYRDTALNTSQYRALGSRKFIDLKDLDENDPSVFNTIYYKEIPYGSSRLPDQRLIVTYSPKYRAYQEKIRSGQITRACRMIDEKGKIKSGRRNLNDPARFITTTHTDSNGEVTTDSVSIIDQDIIDNEKMYDGYYAVVTDIEADVSEIMAINQRRWEIEECFRIMKTEFKARPIYLSREDHIKAHFLICFLALLVYRLLEAKLGSKYTAENLIDTLGSMRLVDVEGQGYIPAYTRTDLTDDLHSLLGFRTDTQIIRKSKMRSILKQIHDR